MLTSDFDYNLPLELIAQRPVSPRDSSRLMVIDREKQTIKHENFFNIIDYLRQGDLLVWNNSKVFKARLFGRLEAGKKDVNHDGRKDKPLFHQQTVEIFLLRPAANPGVWKVLAKPGRRVKAGLNARFAPDFFCEILLKEKDGTILAQFPDNADIVREKANKYGQVPVPPYIKELRSRNQELGEQYQTVYARREGSVAAPTAGFHFTSELIQKLEDEGIEFAEVTLHVGLGTFQPVKTKNIGEHKMHAEYAELTEENAKKINRTKKEGRRVIAVGTTTVRTLEGIASLSLREAPQMRGDEAIPMTVKSYSGEIDIFITPGFQFQVIDALITNFHLPKSTLLMLVSAFIGDRQRTLEIYKTAMEEKYRFYSFGDAMLIV